MSLRAIYYDTETTGLKPEKDRIIEIAAYDPERNRKFEKLVNPGCSIPAEASAISNITNEMVASASTFAAVAAEFIEFCDGDVVLVAHNNDQFDIHFLKCEFQRHALHLPTWKFLDSLKWARRYRPDLPRHNLQFLREIYGIRANNADRALDDVIVLHQLFQAMIDDLSIQDVYDCLNIPRSMQVMPFGKHQGQPLSQIPSTYVKWLASSGAFDKEENFVLKESFQKLGLLDSVAASVA